MNETIETTGTPEISGKNVNNFIRVQALMSLLALGLAIWLIVKYELGFWSSVGIIIGSSIITGTAGTIIAPSPISNDQKLKVV